MHQSGTRQASTASPRDAAVPSSALEVEAAISAGILLLLTQQYQETQPVTCDKPQHLFLTDQVSVLPESEGYSF